MPYTGHRFQFEGFKFKLKNQGMKKLLLGLILALTTTSLSYSQTVMEYETIVIQTDTVGSGRAFGTIQIRRFNYLGKCISNKYRVLDIDIDGDVYTYYTSLGHDIELVRGVNSVKVSYPNGYFTIYHGDLYKDYHD